MARGIGPTDPSELLEAASIIKERLTQAVEQAGERLELERRVRENPWAVLAVAAGAGFVLGGGLWPALRPIVRTAVRTALAPSNLVAIAAALGAMRATGGEEEATGGDDEATAGGDGPTSH